MGLAQMLVEEKQHANARETARICLRIQTLRLKMLPELLIIMLLPILAMSNKSKK
jgi:hypothetical protein